MSSLTGPTRLVRWELVTGGLFHALLWSLRGVDLRWDLNRHLLLHYLLFFSNTREW